MSKLLDLRSKIEEIDKIILEYFEKRMGIVKEIGIYKIENNIGVFDESREKILIEKNLKNLKNKDLEKLYVSFLKNLMELSKTYQKNIIKKNIIGYQGIEGAFSHIAATKIFPNYDLKSYKTFEEVIKGVINDEVSYGVLPFENSYAGEVAEISELLKDNEIYIEKSFDLKIKQNLLGLKDSNISDIKEVYSHFQALSQSNLFLKGLNAKLNVELNTAVAAKLVAESKDISKAAIASKETGELYGLKVLAEDINSTEDNTTRFIVVSKNYSDKGDYFQLLFKVKDESGALAKVLNIIAKYHYNMISLKSHSIRNESWSYYFHVEIQGKLESATKMLDEIKIHCINMKSLGGYDKF